MNEFTVIDFLGDEWAFALNSFDMQPNGLWNMWVWVTQRPGDVLKNYQTAPFPVFTEWFE